MDWAQILVIILAAVLAIFLILSVILVGVLIKITLQIKSVTASAERTARQVEDMVKVSKGTAWPLLVFSAVMRRAGALKKKGKKSER